MQQIEQMYAQFLLIRHKQRTSRRWLCSLKTLSHLKRLERECPKRALEMTSEFNSTHI